MNKCIKGLIYIPTGIIKTCLLKAFHPIGFSGNVLSAMSPLTEVTLESGGKLSWGKNFRMRDGAKIRVRKKAVCKIGENTSINSNNVIACRKYISIGNNVELSPNVQIYDHDHDFRCERGIRAGLYKTSPVIVGNNVWIGANTVVLRGAVIGDNVVIGAGSVVSGEIPAGTVFIQKRNNEIRL